VRWYKAPSLPPSLFLSSYTCHNNHSTPITSPVQSNPVQTMSTSSSNPASPNALPYFSTRAFALHAIPISYALAYPPHLYFFTKLMSATGFKASNMAPRSNLSALSANLPKATTDMLWRARGCHLNALEGFPLFAAAMVSSHTNYHHIAFAFLTTLLPPQTAF